MPFVTYDSPDQVRRLLSQNRDMIISRHDAIELMRRAARVRAGAFDFCGSLAVGSQWTEIKKFLPEDLLRIDDADRDWYLEWTSHEDENGRGLDDPDWFIKTSVRDNRVAIEGAWLGRSFVRFAEAGLTEEHFLAAGRNSVLREGAAELFELIPKRVVISMGIENIIAECLRHNKLTAAIAASRMFFGQDRELVGYHPNVVVSSSKAAAHRRFMTLSDVPIDEHLVIGDSVIDAEMMPDGAFNIWVVPLNEDHGALATFRDTHLEEMLDKATLILHSNSLFPLVALIRAARTGD